MTLDEQIAQVNVALRAYGVLAAIAPELLFLREMKTQLFIELPFFAGAAPKLHGTSYAGFMMRPTASTNWFQRDSSATSRFLPLMVSR